MSGSFHDASRRGTPEKGAAGAWAGPGAFDTNAPASRRAASDMSENDKDDCVYQPGREGWMWPKLPAADPHRVLTRLRGRENPRRRRRAAGGQRTLARRQRRRQIPQRWERGGSAAMRLPGRWVAWANKLAHVPSVVAVPASPAGASVNRARTNSPATALRL